MSCKKWTEVEEIVDRALCLPEKERIDYIRKACDENTDLENEVFKLLNAIDESDGFLESSSGFRESILGDFFPDSDLAGNASMVGERIDQYKILKLIGHGGMGSVYRATRADGAFDQVVAIKVIRKGMDTPAVKARFQQERQILARLNHANIARLYDGGMTDDGLPYLVMEYVEGLQIDQYCDRYKLNIKKRIELFKSVCQAVQHAHNNLIIHRDLKPQNILVTEKGEVKILDFGIAKLSKVNESNTNHIKTRENNRFITPGYASPEQIQSNPVTTSTDIFTLGVLFHKLIAGVHPFNIKDKGYTEIQNVILQEEPCGLKNILNNLTRKQQDELAENRDISRREYVKRLDSDLNAIIRKSLRKDPTARYKTVRQLVDDIRRYQADMPVQAHKGSLRYNITKFINRHRTGLTTAVAAFLLVVGFFYFYTVQITKERNQAQAEANKASQVTALLFNLFEASDPAEALGDTITARELLSKGVNRAELLEDKPELQAQIFDLIGQIYHRLGNYRKSKNLLENAIDLRKAHFGPQHIETATSMNHLGALLGDMGHYKSAEIYLREAGTIFEDQQESKYSDLASVHSNLAHALRRQGIYDEAENYLRRSLDILTHNFGNNHPETISTLNKLGVTLHNKGDYDSAEDIYRNVLDLRKSIVGENHPDIAESLNSLAALLMNKGRYSEAEELLQEALNIRKTVYRDSHPKVALTLNNLGLVYRDLNKFEQAKYYFDKSLKMRLQLLGENHIETAISWFSLAESKLMIHQPDSALVLFSKAKPVFQNSLSNNHSFNARTRMGIGKAYLLKGNITKARDYLRKGYEQIRNIHPESSLERAIADRQMSDLYTALGEHSKADSLSHRAKTILELIGRKAPSGEDQYRGFVQGF